MAVIRKRIGKRKEKLRSFVTSEFFMFLYTLLFLDAENHTQKAAQHLRTFHHNHFHKDASSAVFAKGDPADNQRNGQNNNQELRGENKR